MDITREQAINTIINVLLENHKLLYPEYNKSKKIPYWISENLKALGVTQQEIDNAIR